MNASITQIPTLPNNPQIGILRFVPLPGTCCSPAMGSMISELFALAWWQSPSLNLKYHWLARQNMRFLYPSHLTLPTYAKRMIKQAAKYWTCSVFVTGTYKKIGDVLSIEAGLFSCETNDNINQIAIVASEGTMDNLTDIVNSCAKTLLRKWFPPALTFLTEHILMDAPLDAFERLCVGLDCLAFGSSASDLSEHHLESALAMSPKSGYLQFMAGKYKRGHNWDIDLCERVLDINDRFIPAYFPISSLEGGLQRAKDLYLEGLSYVPFNTYSYFGLRNICVDLSDLDTILPFCRRHVIRGSFSCSTSTFGDTFLSSAELASDRGNYQMARTLCDEGLRMAEDDIDRADLLAGRADIEEESGNIEEALNYYEKALALDAPPSRSLLYAYLLYKSEQYSKAESILKQLVNRRGDLEVETYCRALSVLADIYVKQGLVEEARSLYVKLCKGTLYYPETYEIAYKSTQSLNNLP